MMGMEVRFHLPGLRYNYPLNMFFTGLQSLHPEYFREGVKIASFFGEFPTLYGEEGASAMMTSVMHGLLQKS